MNRPPRLALLLLAGLASLSRLAQADVLTLNDGTVLKGAIQPTAGGAGAVTILTDKGRLTIPQGRIQNVQAEPPAQGQVELGDAYRATQKYQEAMRAYQAAVAIDPTNAAAHAGMDATQAAVSAQQDASRGTALKEIDTLSSQAQQLIGQHEFEKAESLLMDADKRLPSDAQRARMRKLIGNLYYQWGEDRKDKLDPTGAEAKFRLALGADPDNSDAVNEMLRLWENKPDKRQDIANIYATRLDAHPDDNNLRLKLADIYYSMDRYEDAAKLYLELYQQSDKYRGTQVEERLKVLLDRLHRQAARNHQYDKAIYYYKLLAAMDPETDPSQVVYYQYLDMASKTPPQDAAAQLRLAQYAEQTGLNDQALAKYRALQKIDATRDAARQAILRYANKGMQDAQLQFQRGNYELAIALATGVHSDFADVQEVQDSALELINKANAELQRMQRVARDRAKEILQRADEFYQQASNYFNDLFSTERKGNPYLMSTRNEAAKYYQYAIQAYTDALQKDPTLGSDSDSLVRVRLNECKERLAHLQVNTTQPFHVGAPIPDVTQNTTPNDSRP